MTRGQEALIIDAAETSTSQGVVSVKVDLSGIQLPVLVANGDDDRMVPTHNTYDLARRLPHAQLIIYPDAGHGGIFQYHEDFVTQALAFLAN